MQRQHDDGPELFDQFDDDQFEDLEPAADPETSEFWDHMPNGRLERLREARFQARTRRRSITQTPSTPTAPEVVQRIQEAGQHVDPLLKRAGMLMSAIALLVPVAMAFRSGDDTAAIAAAPSATATASGDSKIGRAHV